MKSRQNAGYRASIGAVTLSTGTTPLAITATFEGGWVQVAANIYGASAGGANGYIIMQASVDGVTQAVPAAAYQVGGTVSQSYATAVRVPQGVHRVGIVFSSGIASVPIVSGELEVST